MRFRWALIGAALVVAVLALPAPAKALAGPIIVLDPGHSGTSLTTIDPETKIRDEEYCNDPEITNVFDVATRLKAKLEAAGYTVLLTKQNAMDTVTKRERADVANNSHAALAVSIHTSGHSFGSYGEIYVQNVTSYRENIYGQNIYFSDPAVAALSAQYGQLFLAERRKIEGPSVVVTVNTGWEDRGLAPGNLPIVQLFSKVPWLLVEAGVPSNETQRDLYAVSLFNSIVACVPVNGPPIQPVVTTTRFEQQDERITKKGTWDTFSKSSASSGSYGRSSSTDAAVRIDFTGTRLDLIGMRGTTTGIGDIYLDGRFQTTIDLASAVAAYQVPLWSTGDLVNRPHTVELVRNPSSASGKYITLDAVDVVGTLTSAPPTITKVDPSFGDPAGGTSVVISGTGFTGVTEVTFGGIPATITSVDSTNQRITAVAPASAAGVAQVQVTAGGGKSADTLADDFTYLSSLPVTRFDATLTTPGFAWSGSWAPYTTTSAYGPSYLRTSASAGYVVISFRGTRLDWITTKGTTTGVAQVYLDDASVATTVDLGAASVAYQQKVWSTGILADGYHTVKILRSSLSASGRYLTIDAVDVAGTLVPITLQETEPLLTWAPFTSPWTSASSTSYSGGSYRYSNVSGASVTIKFTGVSLSVIAKKAPAYGKMRVTVDGTTVFTVDLYSSTVKYQQTVWASGFLTPGDHTVTIERLGTKNASSSGYTIDLDAVELIGVLR
jgi:N-acetylmuramoyl-L-alanine amidase